MFIDKLNIRWRLTLWFGAAMVVLLIIRSCWIYYVMDSRLMVATDAQLVADLELIERYLQTVTQQSEVRELLERFSLRHGNLEIAVRGPEDVLLFQGAGEADRLEQRRQDSQRDSNLLHYTTITTPDGSARSVQAEVDSSLGPLKIEIRRSLWDKHNEVSDFAFTLLTTLPVVFLAALGVGYFIASRALSPIAKMISATQRITAKRLDQRLEVPASRDELAQLAETLNEMIDRLHNSFEEMQRFTADAAHDLRTPVAALRTEVEVCLMADRSTEQYRESLQIVLDEAIHLSRLTSQLLDLSREDHGVQPLRAEPVQLEAIVQMAMEDIRMAAQQKAVSIQRRRFLPLVVTGDPVRLRRVVMNLLDNAVQYTPSGGQIWIDSFRRANHAVLVISDDGPGIPAEDLPHIFERFRRVDKARNRQMGGTGLGLAICKAIVESHGGAIRMESALGHGTKVEVEIPTTIAG